VPDRRQQARFVLGSAHPDYVGLEFVTLRCAVEWDPARGEYRASDESDAPDQYDPLASLAALKLFAARIALSARVPQARAGGSISKGAKLCVGSPETTKLEPEDQPQLLAKTWRGFDA
jgi:hypothetical protein